MTHSSISHSGALAPSTVHGSRPHNPHVAGVSLNHDPAKLHYVPSTMSSHTSINQQDPKFIFVKQTCPTDCSGTECGQRHEHSHTHHGAHSAPHHLTDRQSEVIHNSLWRLLGLSGWTEPTSLVMTSDSLAVAKIIRSTAAQKGLKAILSRASDLPKRLFEIAGPLALDEHQVRRYADCALETLELLLDGEVAQLEKCVDASKISQRRPDREMVFTLYCLGHNFGQLTSTLNEFAENVMRGLEESPWHQGSHHHASGKGPSSILVCASSLCSPNPQPNRGSAYTQFCSGCHELGGNALPLEHRNVLALGTSPRLVSHYQSLSSMTLLKNLLKNQLPGVKSLTCITIGRA